MLEVKMASGKGLYIMLSDEPHEEGLIGMAQCKYCDANMYIPYVDDDVIVRLIEKFANEHECKGSIFSKQQLLNEIKKLHHKVTKYG